MFTVGASRVWRLFPLLICAFATHGLLAGTDLTPPTDGKTTASPVQDALDAVTPLTELSTETSYVGDASFREKEFRKPGPLAPDGRQTDYKSSDQLENSVDFAHRFHLFDQVYLKLGGSYERYDFGSTDAPLPSSLQDINGLIALEYIVHGHVGAFLRFSPGVYYSLASHVGLGNVDVPIAIGSAFKVPYLKNVYGLAGINISILARHVVDPIIGVIWVIRDDLRLQAVPPTPRLIYSFNDHFDFFVGGEVLGQAYKRDDNADYRPQFKRFSGAVIDFSEDRIGGGVTYKPFKGIEIEANGGWDLGRKFDYYRGAGKRFLTEGAPYAKLAFSAEF